MFGRNKKKKRLAEAKQTRLELRPTKGDVHPTLQNRVFFYAILAFIVYLSVLVFRPFVVPVLAGVLLAYLAHPIYRFFRTVVRIRSIAAVLGMVFILAIIVLPVAGMGIAIIDEARDFAIGLNDSEVPAIVNDGLDIYLKTRVEDPNNLSQIQEERDQLLHGLLGEFSEFLINALPGTIAFLGDLIIGIFIVAFIVFYIFVDGERFIHFIQRTAPLPPGQSRILLKETANAVDAIFVGQLFSALLQGLAGGIGFQLFGVPNAFFWGAVMAVMSLLPVVGTPIVWLPAVAWLFVNGDTFNAVGLLAYSGILVMNVDNVAKPILIGDRADIHPILVLIGVLGGIVTFGFIGFVLGPLILALFVTMLKVWRDEYHDENGWDRIHGATRAHHARARTAQAGSPQARPGVDSEPLTGRIDDGSASPDQKE